MKVLISNNFGKSDLYYNNMSIINHQPFKDSRIGGYPRNRNGSNEIGTKKSGIIDTKISLEMNTQANE